MKTKTIEVEIRDNSGINRLEIMGRIVEIYAEIRKMQDGSNSDPSSSFREIASLFLEADELIKLRLSNSEEL